MAHLGTASCRGDPAIFTSLVHPRYQIGSDTSLWRVCGQMGEFWKKDIWIFPINRNGNHWTLVIVDWKKGRMAHFDSFGSKTAFKNDVQVRICIALSSMSADPYFSARIP